MNKIIIKLEKFVLIPIYVIFIIALIGGVRGCSSKKENIKLRKDVNILSSKIDSLNSNIYTKEEINIVFALEGYEISKRILYDQNAIIRKVTRPDDKMNEYDLKIKELRKKL